MRSKVLTTLFSCALALGCTKKAAEPKPVALHIQGTIQLDPKLANQTAATDVIFLIARPVTGGTPLAVKRFTGNTYPIPFHITVEDLMIQQPVQDLPVILSARVDKDGDAISKNPGDLAGAYAKNPVPLQADGVDLVVDEVMR